MRVLKGWTFIRALYTIMGLSVVVLSVTEKQWLSIAFGGYIAAMGIFNFGCASGGCYTGIAQARPQEPKGDIEFEEVLKK